MKKKIAILGANEPHKSIFLKAKEMNLEIHCFAWAKGASCRTLADKFYDISITEKEKILAICKSINIDGIVAVALEPAVPTMAYVSEEMKLSGNSIETANRTTNKFLMRKSVDNNNACLQPKYCLFKTQKDIHLSYPLIVKPTDASGSNGVSKIENSDDLEKALIRARTASSNNEIIIEEFVEGREISVEAISFQGKHYILAITDKETTGAPFFVEIAHHQPSSLSNTIQEKIKTKTLQILDAVQITNGASHTELKITSANDIYLIETASRGGGEFISDNLVRLSTGYDYLKGIIEVALNQFTKPVLINRNHSGVFYLGKETAYIKEFIEINKDQDWVVKYNIENCELQELKRSQDRSGYIIYQSNRKISIF